MSSITAIAIIKKVITATAVIKKTILATAIIKSEITGIPSDCPTLIATLTEAQLNECILPSYDFSDPNVSDDLTAQQQTDLDTFINPETPLVLTKSLFLRGINQRCEINTVIAPLSSSGTGAWSLICRPVDSTPPAEDYLLGLFDASTFEYVFIRILQSGRIEIQCSQSGATKWILSTDNKVVFDNTWVHIYLSFDGVEAKLYIDNVFVDQGFDFFTDKTIWLNSLSGLDSGRIGCATINGTGDKDFFTGNVDVIRMWNVSKSTTERNANYNSGCPTNADSVGLVAEWLFQNDIMPVLKDNFSDNHRIYVNVIQSDLVTDTIC